MKKKSKAFALWVLRSLETEACGFPRQGWEERPTRPRHMLFKVVCDRPA